MDEIKIRPGQFKVIKFIPVCLLIASGIIMLFISGCSLGLKTTPTPTPPPPVWITEWLENPACSPPCWENIQPGIASVDTIQGTLSQYRPNMVAEPKPGSSIVQSVQLYFGLYENLPLSLLITKYGSPDYVRIYLCDPSSNCDTHILFTKIGMVLSVYVSETGEWAINDKVEISPDSRILQIIFLETGLEKYYDLFPDDSHQVTPWNGYEEYP